MSSLRTRLEMDKLDEEIRSCEKVVKKLHVGEKKMPVNTSAGRQSRSKSALGITRCPTRHDCGISKKPNIVQGSSPPQIKDRASTAKKTSKQHFDLRNKAATAKNLHAKPRKETATLRLGDLPKSSTQSIVADFRLSNFPHHSTKLEVPKQTNVNFESAAKFPVPSQHPCNKPIPLETKHLTWGHRLLEENKSKKYKDINHVNTQKDQTRHSKPANSDFCSVQNPSHSSNYLRSSCDPANQHAFDIATPSVTDSLQSYENLSQVGDVVYLNQHSGSTVNRSTDALDTAVHKPNEDVINPVRLLKFLFTEFRDKIGGSRATREDEAVHLLREIDHTLSRITDGNVSRANAKTVHSSTPCGETTHTRSKSPPVRDTDSQSKTAAELHRNLEKTWAVTETAVKMACEQLRHEKDQLQEQILRKKKMLESANDKESVYVQTIESLKTKLETVSTQNEQLSKTIAEVTSLNEELRGENRSIPSLRANLSKLGQRVEDSTLEKEKLLTQVTSNRLEVEKLQAELEKKDADFNEFREGMLENHRVISQQLSEMKLYRSKVQGNLDDIFVSVMSHEKHETDDESCLTDVSGMDEGREGQRGAGDLDARPVTSSPTSGSSSLVDDFDPSWQRISNITNTCDQLEMRVPESIGHSTLNPLQNEGELLPIYGSTSNKFKIQHDSNNSRQLFQSLHQSGSDSSEITVGPLPVEFFKQTKPTQRDNGEIFGEIKKLTKFNVNAKLPNPSKNIFMGRRSGKPKSSDSSDDSHHLSVSQHHVGNKHAQ